MENETPNRQRILTADKHLCVHTIGSSGLFGLGNSFHVSQPEVDRMHTGKIGAFVSRNRLPGGSQRCRNTHRPTPRAQPPGYRE